MMLPSDVYSMMDAHLIASAALTEAHWETQKGVQRHASALSCKKSRRGF